MLIVRWPLIGILRVPINESDSIIGQVIEYTSLLSDCTELFNLPGVLLSIIVVQY